MTGDILTKRRFSYGNLKKRVWRYASGEKVYEYTLTNKKGISASFIDLGAVWTKMLVPDSDGNMTDVILGYDDLESYQINKPHFGAPVAEMQTALEMQLLLLTEKTIN